MKHEHTVITFDSSQGIVIEKCPKCGRDKWLGILGDGCSECQSCYHKENNLGPLPSDSMEPVE